jgi:hypothetical protein
MNIKYLLLAAGLATAGTALAGDPAPQATASGPALKVGIDKATGKLRPLTAEESSALDAKAAQQSGDNISLRANRSGLSPRAQRLFSLPATQKEADATERTINGVVVSKPIADSMSELTVQKNVDGSLSFSENGEPMANKTPEAGNE